MGVSIELEGESVTPGGRSMMHKMLLENWGWAPVGEPNAGLGGLQPGQEFSLGKNDLPTLIKLRDQNAPSDISDGFSRIIERVERDGEATVTCWL